MPSLPVVLILKVASLQVGGFHGYVTRTDLRVALDIADIADAVTLAHYRSAGLQTESKGDLTPVTEADRATERAIRDALNQARPEDSIAGEEYGETGTSTRQWIIDPIDATFNYVRGLPVWATLIALEDVDGVAVGVVSAPAIGHRWWAGRQLGAFRNGNTMRVSTIDSIEQATLSFNSLETHEQHGMGAHAAELSRRCALTRGFGDFLSFMFLADGAVDIVTEPIAHVWDLAPLDIIVTEAGGTFTDVDGTHTIRGSNAVATNGLLHDEVLQIMAR